VGDTIAGSSQALQSGVKQTAAFLQQRGYSPADAMTAAYNHYYNQLISQTRLLGFMDCFFILGVITLVVAPLALLTKYFKVGGGSSAAH
jgi:MFS transporter, DHA2 family, multidrug resistance protein